jgi:hypothetical protein
MKMKKNFVFKYQNFMGRDGIGLYLNNSLVSFTYDVYEAFRMITIALSNGDTVDYQLTTTFIQASAKREVY